MASLPTDGSDLDVWGAELNAYLLTAHNSDGTQKDATVSETSLTLSDNTTANASTSKHGFLKKLDNNSAHFLDGTGSWSTPAGGGGSFVYPQSAIQYFVDYANGSDSNSGLGPSNAFQTIQAAYNAAKTYAEATYLNIPTSSQLGVGTINLLPGYHDLNGTALAITGNRPARFVGAMSGARVWFPSIAQPIIVSSSNLTEMVRIGTNANNSQKGQGHSFQGVAFQVSPTNNASLTKVIWVSVCGNFHVENCSFDTTTNATNLTAVAIYHDDLTTSSGEAGWFRIIRNFSAEMALYYSITGTGATGGNFNRGLIEGNVCFYGGSYPMVGFYANTNACTVAYNNFEGPAVAVEFGGNGSSSNNLFISNSGEDPSSGTPGTFYNLNASLGGTTIIGGECATLAGSSPAAWVTFGTNAFPNLVIGKDVSYTGINSKKSLIINNATYPARNRLIGKDGEILPYKSGAGAKWTSADWPATIENGTGAVASLDTNTDKGSFYMWMGGTLRQFVESTVMSVTQRKYSEVTGQLGTTVIVPATTLTAGKLGVLIFASNANKTVASVADSSGNTWNVDHTVTDGTRAISFCSSQIATNVTSGGSVTATWSSATSSDCLAWLNEIGNAATSSAFDQAADGTGSGTSLVTSASSALSQANEVVFGCFRTSGSLSGFSQGSSYSQAVSFQGGVYASACLEYKIVSSTSAVTADASNTHTGSWVASLATYKSV